MRRRIPFLSSFLSSQLFLLAITKHLLKPIYAYYLPIPDHSQVNCHTRHSSISPLLFNCHNPPISYPRNKEQGINSRNTIITTVKAVQSVPISSSFVLPIILDFQNSFSLLDVKKKECWMVRRRMVGYSN